MQLYRTSKDVSKITQNKHNGNPYKADEQVESMSSEAQ